MNPKNAIHILREDLFTVNVVFDPNSASEYTYMALQGWLPEAVPENYPILVPVKGGKGEYPNWKVAYVVGIGDVTDMDLDTENYEYRYLLGRSLDDIPRWQEANAWAERKRKELAIHRIRTMRGQVLDQLMLGNGKD